MTDREEDSTVTLPIFERFTGTRRLELAGIAELPTPLENLADSLPLLTELDDSNEPLADIHALFVKRDDLTSPRYGGNKVRKLDFLLGDALAQGRKTVLTFGAYGSNHALATAVHARALGLEPHVVLSPQDPGPFAPRTLLAHARLGTVIHLVDGWDGRREAVQAKNELAERDGVGPYVIPMGGTCALGAVGYVNAALEVVDQVREGERSLLGGFLVVSGDIVEPDVAYLAAGTLGTAVGLAIGFAASHGRTRVEAIRVTPETICNEDIARKLTAETVSLLRSVDPSFPELRFEDLAFTLRDEFFEPGYGVVTPQSVEAVEIADTGGLHLETTYTGKAFSAMLSDSREGRLSRDHVLFWQTYNSSPYPEPGDIKVLPARLRDYIAECRRLFPDAP